MLVPRAIRCVTAARTMVFASMLLVAAQADAAGSGMPWEEPLQKVLDSVPGPVA
jgi:type IV secretion system protein VirB2